MRFGADSIGPIDKEKPDYRPDTVPSLHTIQNSLRAAFLSIACSIPSSVYAEPVSAEAIVQSWDREQKLEEYEQEMYRAWRELARCIKKRNNHVDEMYEVITHHFKNTNQIDTFNRVEQGCEEIIQLFRNGDDGREFHTVEGQLRLQRETSRFLETYEKYLPTDSFNKDQFTQKNMEDLLQADVDRLRAEERYRKELMTDNQGRHLRLYPEELADNPSLTPKAYLDLLVQRLRTAHDLGMFLRLFFRYTIDTDDETQPLKKGTWATSRDYWQLPSETLLRVENGVMLGDCDDQTLLFEEILRHMQKRPVTVYLPGNNGAHVTTVWIEECENGFVLYEIGTDGLYENGTLRCMAAFEDGYIPHKQITAGHDTPAEAIKAGLDRFRGSNLQLDDFDSGYPCIRTTPDRWKPNTHVHANIQSIPFNDFIAILVQPKPPTTVTAEAPPPPPPE